MIQAVCRVEHVEQVAENIFVLTFVSPEIAAQTQAGQFVNIKADEGTEPLLRRPFSVYRIYDDRVQVLFNVVGKGTSCLRRKQQGEKVDVLGPLGSPFSLTKREYDLAILAGGGLGVAPFPVATAVLKQTTKSILTYLGARSESQLVTNHLMNVHIATDDGSKGFHGNIVELMEAEYETFRSRKVRIFACGPTPMLRAVAQFAKTKGIPCEVSLEGPMACGFGICQGCPVEFVDGERRYGLVCKDGPTFDVTRIRI